MALCSCHVVKRLPDTPRSISRCAGRKNTGQGRRVVDGAAPAASGATSRGVGACGQTARQSAARPPVAPGGGGLRNLLAGRTGAVPAFDAAAAADAVARAVKHNYHPLLAAALPGARRILAPPAFGVLGEGIQPIRFHVSELSSLVEPCLRSGCRVVYH